MKWEIYLFYFLRTLILQSSIWLYLGTFYEYHTSYISSSFLMTFWQQLNNHFIKHVLCGTTRVWKGWWIQIVATVPAAPLWRNLFVVIANWARFNIAIWKCKTCGFKLKTTVVLINLEAAADHWPWHNYKF